MALHNHISKITEIAASPWTSSFRTSDLWTHGLTMAIEKANSKISSEYIKRSTKKNRKLVDNLCVFWVQSSAVPEQPLECWPCRVLLRGCSMAYRWPGRWSIDIHLTACVQCMTSLIFFCTFSKFVSLFPGWKRIFNSIFHFLAGPRLCFSALIGAPCSSPAQFCASTWRSWCPNRY